MYQLTGKIQPLASVSWAVGTVKDAGRVNECIRVTAI
jgi:hypothetical protein